MWYVLGGMATGIVVVAVAECFIGKYAIKEGNFGLANVAPTVASIFGLKAPECWEESMI